MRKLVPLSQLIEDIEDEGLDADQISIDREDLIELPENPEEE